MVGRDKTTRDRAAAVQATARAILVTRFTTYQEYLAALYQDLKEAVSPYSYLLFAEDLGFSATNVLRLVIAGKRALSLKSAKTIAKALQLSKEEKSYFFNLVMATASRSATRRERSFQDLILLKQATVASSLDQEWIEYFRKWYYPVIREMARIGGIIESADWIVRHIFPKIKREEAEKAIRLLERLRILSFDHQKKVWRIEDDAPVTLPGDSAANAMMMVQYHKQMLGIAGNALIEQDEEVREFNAITLALSAANAAKVRTMIQELCAGIMALENEDQKREVVTQFNVQLFKAATFGNP